MYVDEQQRNQVFQEDLAELLKGKYITNDEYEKFKLKY